MKIFKRFIIFAVISMILFLPVTFANIQGTKAVEGAPPAITVLDLDVNNDGVIEQSDIDAFDTTEPLPCYSTDSRYIRRFDIDCNGTIDENDEYYVKYGGNLGLNLEQIRKNLSTGEVTTLTWPNTNMSVKLKTLSPDPAKMKAFCGEYTSSNIPWLHGTQHQYVNGGSNSYVCGDFATDLAVAAYKTLGYGAIMYAESYSPYSHSYDIYYTGNRYGNGWHNLANWNIIEPQTGDIAQATNPPDDQIHNTYKIYFYYDIDNGWLQVITLDADFTAGTVDYHPGTTQPYSLTMCKEEQLPSNYTFDTSLDFFGYHFVKDWNAISVPYETTASALGVDEADRWDRDSQSWVPTEYLDPGEGYWVKSSADKNVTIWGPVPEVSSYTTYTQANTGTVFGSPFTVSCKLTLSNGTITYLYYYDGSSYQNADPNNLQPGFAYFIETDSDAAITLTPNSP